ncbi:Transglutaminase-like superfamily protein [Agromyces sp. CF514]|uniref:transglutaminase-like domain-containing protein n=1 Tax=Agromyces sp. CF514 TaxID=1881031 RepID=UPI0008E671CF|nr:transglutaminase-like domain-containing protein [Agromyces sp. CF514]SFR72798.1 Transglutaminase-like superfamily protein [Agromyces sp. CF514]
MTDQHVTDSAASAATEVGAAPSSSIAEALLARYRTHSPFTDPGSHADLLRGVGTDFAALHRTVEGLVDHYRATPGGVGPEQVDDIDRRWVSSQLDALTARQAGALDAPRPPACRLGGCCRDHSLLAVAILREHGIPARTRLGFAGYFSAGYRHDHVVAERWDAAAERWRRFDPELEQAGYAFAVDDLPRGGHAGFRTAAEAWLEYRSGRTDLADHGVGPGTPFHGPSFVHRYVIADLAHRQCCEVLLWDGWGAMAFPGDELTAEQVELTDLVARLTVAADAGDAAAEIELDELWAHDARVRPGRYVETHSPAGRGGRTDLALRTTVWGESVAEVLTVEAAG